MYFVRLICLFALMHIVVGCGSRRVTTSDAAKSQEKKGATSEGVLASAVYQLRPQNFDLNTTRDKPVSLLNSWRFQRLEEGEGTDRAESVKTPDGWLTAPELERLAQSKYDLQDSTFVRDSMLYHAIAGHASERGRNEAQQVALIIDFVCRNVVFWRDDEQVLPMTAFKALQLGRGSAEDRASVCAEILRQLKVDCVIVRAKSDEKETTDKWLFGVVIAGKTHLYDLHLAMPMANGSADNTSEAATLDQLVQHPEFLDQMSADSKYRLTIDDLKEPNVYVAFNPNALCRRMQTLELSLPTSDSARLFDPLIDEKTNTGSLERIAAAVGTTIDRLKPWTFPTAQVNAVARLAEFPEKAQQFQMLAAPLNVPIPFQEVPDPQAAQSANPNQKKEPNYAFGTPERKLERIRTDHLLGKFTEVTQRYLGIRHLEVEPNPPQLEQLNRMAAEDAFFWASICKMETEDYQGAADLFSSYLKKYDRKGKWYFAARTLLARSLAKQGKFDEAIRTLERRSSDDPNQDENALRVKQWKSASGK